MANIEEVRRVNEVLQRYFDHNGQLANIHPYPANAFRLMLNKELFGNADGPPPLTEAEAITTFTLGDTSITKAAVRTQLMTMLDTLIETMTRERDNDRPLQFRESEQRLLQWLYAITPALEQSVVHPASSATLTHTGESSIAPTIGSDDGGVPVESSNETTNVDRQIPEAANDQQTTYVSNPPALAAAQPQNVLQMPMAGPVQTAPFYQLSRVGNGLVYQPVAMPMPMPVPFYAPPPFQVGGVGPQTVVGIPPQHPQFMGNYGPVYAPPMVQHGYNIPSFGYGQALPMLQQPFPFMGNQQVPLFTQGQAPLLPNPAQQRNTLPPATREASRSTWANPRVLNSPPRTQHTSASFVSGFFQSKASNSSSNNQSSSPQQSTTPVNAVTARYGPTSDTMYRPSGGVSQQLQQLTASGTPSYSAAIDSTIFPFEETARTSAPVTWGVIRIDNIPYSLTKQEVIGFLGRNSQVATYGLSHAIHITMDRITGKTNDCFVEFANNDAAQAAVASKSHPGQMNRMGERFVSVHLSSQDELLKHLFPRAVNVQWQNAVPSITGSVDPFNSGFKCLTTAEECHMMKQHAQAPQRSQYTRQCPQRVYEWMITTLYKFPWYAGDMYTLQTRNHIYDTLMHLLRTLLSNVDKGTHPALNDGLVRELLYAGLNAAGFSEKQRWDLTRDGGIQGRGARISPLAKHWPFYILGRKINVPEDVMEWYVDRLTRHLDVPSARPTMNPFRTFILPPNRGLEATAAEMGALEIKCVLDIYKMTLPE